MGVWAVCPPASKGVDKAEDQAVDRIGAEVADKVVSAEFHFTGIGNSSPPSAVFRWGETGCLQRASADLTPPPPPF